MTDTMRRIRSYKRGTKTRKESRTFQRGMLVHLVRASRYTIRAVKGYDQ